MVGQIIERKELLCTFQADRRQSFFWLEETSPKISLSLSSLSYFHHFSIILVLTRPSTAMASLLLQVYSLFYLPSSFSSYYPSRRKYGISLVRYCDFSPVGTNQDMNLHRSGAATSTQRAYWCVISVFQLLGCWVMPELTCQYLKGYGNLWLNFLMERIGPELLPQTLRKRRLIELGQACISFTCNSSHFWYLEQLFEI